MGCWDHPGQNEGRRRSVRAIMVHDLVQLPGEVQWSPRGDVSMGTLPAESNTIRTMVQIEVIIRREAGRDVGLRPVWTETKVENKARLQRVWLDAEPEIEVSSRDKALFAAIDGAGDFRTKRLQGVEVEWTSGAGRKA